MVGLPHLVGGAGVAPMHALVSVAAGRRVGRGRPPGRSRQAAGSVATVMRAALTWRTMSAITAQLASATPRVLASAASFRWMAATVGRGRLVAMARTKASRSGSRRRPVPASARTGPFEPAHAVRSISRELMPSARVRREPGRPRRATPTGRPRRRFRQAAPGGDSDRPPPAATPTGRPRRRRGSVGRRPPDGAEAGASARWPRERRSRRLPWAGPVMGSADIIRPVGAPLKTAVRQTGIWRNAPAAVR